ncbi:alpha/beta fold hydrolase [Virgibacillus sp. LDC-1]|uniref:alpha/beta fold hydrolase n=1 Tax=Virgibacillus sp. LDC-1 TaxID=3039856 RepID=UPI0024DEAFCA|nr:alpha/beta fold hydrolase [Virgibacillus sp. LDC-1]
MPTIKVNDVHLFYEDRGSGEALILLHGLTGSHHMLMQELENFQADFRVIAIDARGHGKSDKPRSYTLADHIEDVIQLMDALDIPEANLLGMSMGTYVAQGVAIAVPDRIKKMILISGSTHAKSDGTGLLAAHADEMEGFTFEEQMAHLATHIFHQMDEVGKWLQRLPGGLTPEEQEAGAKALAQFDFRPQLHTVTADTLVISGRYDGLNPPEEGQEIAAHIPGARMVVFEHSGHAPNIEEKEKYMELVTSFLKQ